MWYRVCGDKGVVFYRRLPWRAGTSSTTTRSPAAARHSPGTTWPLRDGTYHIPYITSHTSCPCMCVRESERVGIYIYIYECVVKYEKWLGASRIHTPRHELNVEAEYGKCPGFTLAHTYIYIYTTYTTHRLNSGLNSVPKRFLKFELYLWQYKVLLV